MRAVGDAALYMDELVMLAMAEGALAVVDSFMDVDGELT
jgi:hypothetical protein